MNQKNQVGVRRKRISKKALRRRKRRKILIRWTGFIILLCLIRGWILKNDPFSWNEKHSREAGKKEYDTSRIIGEASEQKLKAPRKYSMQEIEDILEELSQSSKEYREIYENMDSYPESLLSALCNNEEMLDFALGYGKEEAEVDRGLTEKELNAKFPLLLQWDKRWGYVPYGESCIGLSGCAPTCVSMVVITLTDNEEATPDKIAAYAQNTGYYVENTGTAWSFMTEGVSHFGIEGRELSLSKNMVMNELKQGHPVICSMRPGDFTSQGHFIVLVKVQDGKIMVNDPNSIKRSSVLWDYEEIEPQIKNLWFFYKE